jgi:CheY-like chemotaxis protein
VLLTVADTGVGMDEATIQRIFEPFFSTKGTGRGLGLAAVQGIVRSHHGFLCVQSRLGQGTQFQIWLPTEPVTASAHPRISFYPHNTGHVLVVDDDATIRDVVGKMIEHIGFQVVFADHGERALELINSTEQPWTIMLIDITMPGMSGIDVVMQLQESHPQLPIVLMSGYRTKEIPNTLPAHVAFLPKPFSYATLRDTIAQVLAYTRGTFPASASPDTS